MRQRPEIIIPISVMIVLVLTSTLVYGSNESSYKLGYKVAINNLTTGAMMLMELEN